VGANVNYDLRAISRSRAKGSNPGIYSVCSAHPWVLEAAMRRVIANDEPLLIEATCNQVNQFGGYTGMTPEMFRLHVLSIATRVGFSLDRLLLGGDHLGPHPWRHLPAIEAMKNAAELIANYVRAGFTKIHLDTSMACNDDQLPLPDAVIAERAAMLAQVAEATANHDRLRYVIGTEVPTPGGATEELSVAITKPEAAEEALTLHKRAFEAAAVQQAWDRVIALVVQPGVEFGHDDVVDYEHNKAVELCALLKKHPGLVFEAHSTDYQKPEAYAQLVHDGFAILKVGPALTFSMRQGLFALEAIEQQVVPEADRSHLAEVMERVMLANPEHWKQHYEGDPQTLQRLRVHSYSDRIRYYWNVPEATESISKLLANLEHTRIPTALLSDYLPDQYRRVREGSLENAPVALVMDKIGTTLDPYISACRQD
jgi:D-tagatose-1,6-bisphosphate aldolase subunit GatZ/KbaZ